MFSGFCFFYILLNGAMLSVLRCRRPISSAASSKDMSSVTEFLSSTQTGKGLPISPPGMYMYSSFAGSPNINPETNFSLFIMLLIFLSLSVYLEHSFAP